MGGARIDFGRSPAPSDGRTLGPMTSVTDEQTRAPSWHRPLLPGELLEAPGGRRSARDWVVDVVLFLGALGIGVLGLSETWSDHNDVMVVLDVVAGVAVCLALWIRRRRPVGVAVAAAAVAAFSAMAGGAVIVAVFNAAVRASRRALLGIVALSLVSLTIFPLLYPSVGSLLGQVLFGILLLAVAVGWGLFTRARRELIRSLRDRAERLESEQRLRVVQAREAERRRIAREMHDVLAHRLSLLSVHAGALEFRPDASPEEVAEAAGVIRATAQTALQELRDVIGVLRDEAEESTLQPPQPTLAQLPALVEESRAVGMRIDLRIDVPVGEEMPAAVGRTAYRIVQEGLTNARKHAPAAAVEVSVSSNQDPALIVRVLNRRAVGVPAATGSRAASVEGSGSGLVGLAERVSLAGGELKHGPDEHGDFVLIAILPWTP
jgi:signal transduction histidine kinase